MFEFSAGYCNIGTIAATVIFFSCRWEHFDQVSLSYVAIHHNQRDWVDSGATSRQYVMYPNIGNVAAAGGADSGNVGVSEAVTSIGPTAPSRQCRTCVPPPVRLCRQTYKLHTNKRNLVFLPVFFVNSLRPPTLFWRRPQVSA